MKPTDTFAMGRPNLEVFAETLMELAAENPSLYAVTSDSRGSGKLIPFANQFPGQVIEVGIAEQNLVGVAAGLASTGKTVFATSPGCFLTTRALEQVKNDVAYSDYPVKLTGISAGVSYGALGSTHHSLHDIATLRAIHNMIIVVPADNFETRQAIIAAARIQKPFYLRFGKKPMPILYESGARFEIGKSNEIMHGNDVAFIACGEAVTPACEAAKILYAEGIQARVISMHTIKPLDTNAIALAAKKCKAIITVEEHSINGGLGEACASFLMEQGLAIPFRRVAIPDEDTVTGSQKDILDHYGISGPGLVKTAKSVFTKTP